MPPHDGTRLEGGDLEINLKQVGSACPRDLTHMGLPVRGGGPSLPLPSGTSDYGRYLGEGGGVGMAYQPGHAVTALPDLGKYCGIEGQND